MSPVTKITNDRDLAALFRHQKNVSASIEAVHTNLHANLTSVKANIDTVNKNINRLELRIQELEGRVVEPNDTEAAQQYARRGCSPHCLEGTHGELRGDDDYGKDQDERYRAGAGLFEAAA